MIKLHEEVSITIELPDFTVHDCFIVAFPRNIHGSYIALLPKEKQYMENGKLLLFKYIEQEGNIPKIIGIEDDAELEYADGLLAEIIDDSVYLDLIKKYKNKFD